MVIEIILGISLILNAALGAFLYRASKRLLQFDDLFVLLEDDLVASLKFFTKLIETPFFQNSPEIQEAQKNIVILKKRMDEFVLRIGETTSRVNVGTKEGEG